MTPTLTGMTTQYAARHVALGGDDSEPEGLASSWGDGPAPRRAMMPEEAVTSYQPYEPEPELMPFSSVAQQDLPFQRPTPSEFGEPVVAVAPSRTMEWHLAAASTAPLDPGPVDATAPVSGAMVDPASVPTPVSQYAAVSYQSMPSPAPYVSTPAQGMYASVPAQGALTAPIASTYANQVPAPYETLVTPNVGQGMAPVLGDVIGVTSADLELNGAPVGKALITAQRIYGLVVIALVVGGFTWGGVVIGGQVWWMTAFAWAIGLFMLYNLLRPRRA